MHITLVPTPIGNLEDITLRALRVLKEADMIAAEDTRTTSKLLAHYDIHTPLTAVHQHNEHTKVQQLLEQVEQKGLKLAVVSDAGTPAISDPGFLIVREAIKRGITVETLPGATAFVPALVNSGFPCDSFVFEGFLPVKKGRQTTLLRLKAEERTFILYESPHKLLKTLDDLLEHLGAERQMCICRELSKIHEECVRGTIPQLIAHFKHGIIKGEFVLVVSRP